MIESSSSAIFRSRVWIDSFFQDLPLKVWSVYVTERQQQAVTWLFVKQAKENKHQINYKASTTRQSRVVIPISYWIKRVKERAKGVVVSSISIQPCHIFFSYSKKKIPRREKMQNAIFFHHKKAIGHLNKCTENKNKTKKTVWDLKGCKCDIVYRPICFACSSSIRQAVDGVTTRRRAYMRLVSYQ